MPAVPYPVSPMPAQPLYAATGMARTAPGPRTTAELDPVLSAAALRGDPAAVSGPASRAAPDLLMGTLGWGAYTSRFTPVSSRARQGKAATLQDARQGHYNPPGSIPGPGGKLLTAPGLTRTVGPVAARTAPVTLAALERGLRPTQQGGLVPPEVPL